MRSNGHPSEECMAEINKLPQPTVEEVIVFCTGEAVKEREKSIQAMTKEYLALRDVALNRLRELMKNNTPKNRRAATVAVESFSVIADEKATLFQTAFLHAKVLTDNLDGVMAVVSAANEARAEQERKITMARNAPFFAIKRKMHRVEYVLEDALIRMDDEFLGLNFF